MSVSADPQQITRPDASKESADPYRELIALCRAGRLFEVDEWFKAGKPTESQSPRRRPTPIGVATEKGFHSLVEVLLRHGVSPTGFPLRDAVYRGHADLVDLLFRYGADVHSVRFETVISCGNPNIIRLFIDRGADLVTDYPIAEGLKRITKPMLEIYKRYIQKFPHLAFQANVALRYFCREGRMRSACLLLWAGADPRAKVPDENEQEEEFWRSALWEAAYKGHLDILKKRCINCRTDTTDRLTLWIF